MRMRERERNVDGKHAHDWQLSIIGACLLVALFALGALNKNRLSPPGFPQSNNNNNHAYDDDNTNHEIKQ